MISHRKLLEWVLCWFGSTLCLALLLPNHYQPWLSFHQEWMTVVAIAPLLGWSLWQQYTNPLRQLPWLVVGALFGAAVVGLQYAAGSLLFYSDGLMAAVYWLLFAGTILAGHQLASRHTQGLQNRLQPFWIAWVAAGILSWAIALHQWLDLQYLGLFIAELPPNGRPFANLAQPNHLATLLLFSMAGTIYLYETRTISPWTTGALAVLLCQGLAMTQSRSALLGLTLGGLVFMGLVHKRRHPRFPLWGFGAIVVIYLAWTISWPALNAALLLANDTRSTLERTSPGIRITYWLSALEAIAQKPWLGWGFGQIGLAQQATALHYPATETFFSSAHNILLDIALWMGIPCSLILLLLLYRHLRDGWKTTANASPSLSSWLALAFMTGHALVELPLLYTYFLLPTGFLLGSIITNTQSGTTISIGKAPNKAISLLLALLFLSLFPKISMEYLTWEENWRRVRFELQNYSNSEPTLQPSFILLDQLAAMQKVALQHPSRGMKSSELEEFRRNAARYPSSLALLRYAYAAALNNQADAATHTLELLCSLHKMAVCQSAGKEWTEAGRSKWPELQAIEFPQTIKYQERDNASN